MIDGITAFFEFKQLANKLREWGYETRDEGDFGEFGINGYFCSYRYFGVLDIDFLLPGQQLLTKQEPDLVFCWDGAGWREVTDDGVLEVRRASSELFNRCLKRLNYDVAPTIGLSPSMCLLLSPAMY